MNCEQARTHLSLFLYGELSGSEAAAFRQHLDHCEGCRQELEREKAVNAALDLAQVSPPVDLLEDCRRALRQTLPGAASARRSWPGILAGLLRPAAAVALVVAGFAAGRLMPSQRTERMEAPPADPVAMQVRSVEPDPSGTVRIVLDETRRRVLSGDPEDESIRGLLLAAAKDASNPGLGVESRLKAIDLLVQHREIRLAGVLQELLTEEADSYVRQRSEKALREMRASVGTF